MTEREEISWDHAELSIANALSEGERLLAQVPDSHDYTAVRNRITMSMTELDTARDFLAAARARMPETETK